MATVDGGPVYALLRREILTLRLVPGERVSERSLEPLLGASRTPIRAALMRLEAEGLVQRSERAWRVAPIDLAQVRAIIEYREAIETAAVAHAIARASQADVARLREIAASVPGDDEERFLADGTDFHLGLALLSGNPFLAEGMASALTRLIRARWLAARSGPSPERVRDEHEEIVAAIEARDAGAAAALVVAHARETGERLTEYLREEQRRLRGRGFTIVDAPADAPARHPARPGA